MPGVGQSGSGRRDFRRQERADRVSSISRASSGDRASGFACDVFGNGKTAIRGGAAILYNPRLSKWSNMVNNPPAIFTPITYYGDMRTFLQTSRRALAQQHAGLQHQQQDARQLQHDASACSRTWVTPSWWTFPTLGVLGQHIPQTLAINTVPYGTHFLPQYTGGVTDNFFRPFPGYNNVSWTDNAYNSNYHALLLSINRRFANGLQFGFSYTFSKFMDYTGIPIYRPLRTWSYGFDGSDQTHNAVLNFTYELPRASRMVNNNKVVKWVFDDWTLSGIAQWVSGTPASISFSTVQGTDLTGGGDGQRVNIVGNPNANGSTFYAWFNPAAFAVPGKGDPGNAAKNSVRNPGVNNTDLALSKRFPVKSEKRYFTAPLGSVQRLQPHAVFGHQHRAAVRPDHRRPDQRALRPGHFDARAAHHAGSLRFTF